MIRIHLTFTSDLSLTIARDDIRLTIAEVEEIMWRHMARIKRINVIAPGSDAAEGARVRHYLKVIQLDANINRGMERNPSPEIDIYELIGHPRRGAEKPC